MTDPATTRRLDILDDLADIGLTLTRRLVDLPPLGKQNVVRDYEILARAIRKTVLLAQLIQTDRLPFPKVTRENAPDRLERPETFEDFEDFESPEPFGPDTRLDRLDPIDTVDRPFEHTVTAIVRGIQAALATSHNPVGSDTLVHAATHPRFTWPPKANTT